MCIRVTWPLTWKTWKSQEFIGSMKMKKKLANWYQLHRTVKLPMTQMGRMDGWLGFNGILSMQVACMKEIMHSGWLLWKRSLISFTKISIQLLISKSVQLISVCSTVNRYKVYILGDLHPLVGKNVLNMYDLYSKTIVTSLSTAS